MPTLFCTRNAKKATFVAVLTFAFALVFICLDSKSGYRPFYRAPVSKAQNHTMDDTAIPIGDAEFERLIGRIGCDEYALKASQEAEIIQR